MQVSPYPHIVTLALEEANIPYDTIDLDLNNKPDWYKNKVYPTAKVTPCAVKLFPNFDLPTFVCPCVPQVPYLVYGGPKLEPGDAPSSDLPQLGESLVIVEFLADTFPEARLLPADPFLRAKARLFSRAVLEKYGPAFFGFVFRQTLKEDLYAAVEHIQALLPPGTGYAVGEWSIADAAFLGVYLRTLATLEIMTPAMANVAPGLAEEVLRTLRESPRFARIQKYLEECMARPSAKKTWDPVRSNLVFCFETIGCDVDTDEAARRCR